MLLKNIAARKIREKNDFDKILSNIGWLFLDKVLRVGTTFILTAWMARYLGVEAFGLWNYAIAFVALFSIFSTLGLDAVIVKHLLKNDLARYQVLGSAFWLRTAGGIVGILLSLLLIALVRPREPVLLSLVLVTAAAFLFQSFDVIDFYFQAHLQSRLTVLAKNAAFLLAAGLKVLMILGGASLMALALATLLEVALGAAFLGFIYRRWGQHLLAWKPDKQILRSLVREGLPLMFTGMVVLIYMRTDQLMIGNMLDDSAVGAFSAAVRLSEAWYFIPLIVTNSTFPAILKARAADEKDYYRKLQRLFDLMAWLGIATAVGVSWWSHEIIGLFFGKQYEGAGPVLALHTWTSVFVFLGFASGNWFVAEGLQKYSFYRTAAGAVINVGMNYILIPVYGIMGAAAATLFSQFVASYFFNAFSQETRGIFKMQTIALVKVLFLIDLLKFVFFKKK